VADSAVLEPAATQANHVSGRYLRSAPHEWRTCSSEDTLRGRLEYPGRRIGTGLAPVSDMAQRSVTSSIRTVLQSVLCFGNRMLWCEVTSRGQHDYEVHVVPQ